MIARNVVSSAATAQGYGLAVARAVGRNSASLRRAAARVDGVGVIRLGTTDARVPTADLKTLAAAGLIALDMAGRHVTGWRITEAGRALAARL